MQLFTDGETLYSCEGTTQGDCLAIAMYAVGTLPLIQQLHLTNGMQMMPQLEVSYMRFITVGKVNTLGPSFGYFPNPQKTWLIVKRAHLMLRRCFMIPVLMHGKICSVFSTEYVQDKVSDSVRNYLPLPRLSHMLHTLHLPVAYPVSGPII